MPDKIAIVQRSIDVFNAEGIEAALDCFPPDVVVHPFPEWIEASAYRGHEGLKALMAIWTESFDHFEIVASEFREVGDRVVMLGELAGQIKGVPLRQPLGVVYANFTDSQVGEFRNFRSWREALEAAGLQD